MTGVDVAAVASLLKTGRSVLFAGPTLARGLFRWWPRHPLDPTSASCCVGRGSRAPALGGASRRSAPRDDQARLAARIAGFPGKISVRCLNHALTDAQCARLEALRQQLGRRAPERGLLDLIAAADDGWLGAKPEHLGELTGAELVAEVYQRLGVLSTTSTMAAKRRAVPAAPLRRALGPPAQARLCARSRGRAPRPGERPGLGRRQPAARVSLARRASCIIIARRHHDGRCRWRDRARPPSRRWSGCCSGGQAAAWAAATSASGHWGAADPRARRRPGDAAGPGAAAQRQRRSAAICGLRPAGRGRPDRGLRRLLAGVLTGMAWARANRPECPWIATLATDTPYFPTDLVARLLAAVEREGADLACATSGGRAHPVFGLWRSGPRTTCAPRWRAKRSARSTSGPRAIAWPWSTFRSGRSTRSSTPTGPPISPRPSGCCRCSRRLITLRRPVLSRTSIQGRSMAAARMRSRTMTSNVHALPMPGDEFQSARSGRRNPSS